MAKSTLIQGLQRAYLIARFAAHHKISATTALDILETKLGRRRLLQGSLAVASGLATLALHRQVNAISNKTPVLIVGAGIAGLTAAYYLNRAGIPIRIIEASQRVGGRILSLNQALGTETTVELGGEFIDAGHQNIRKLAQELGLTEIDLLEVDRGLQQDIWFFNNRLISEQEIVTAFIPLAQQIDRDVKAMGDVNYKSTNPQAIKLDRTSLAAYVDRHCLDPILRQLIKNAYINEYGLEAERQSALNLLLLIGRDTDKFAVFGSSDQRYCIRGGNQQIVNKLAEKLSNHLETNTRLESIRMTASGRYRVSLRQGNSSKIDTFDRVILALPFNVLRQIDLGLSLPPRKKAAIQEIGYGTNSKLLASYSDRLWRKQYQSNGQAFSDLEPRETWESGRYTSSQVGIITYFSGGDLGVKIARSSANTASQRLTQQLDNIFPGVKKLALGKAKIANWIDAPYINGSYACYLVGQWTKFAGAEGERVGNLFFIGEHCSIEAQGYMEGGCATGLTAAAAIIKELG